MDANHDEDKIFRDRQAKEGKKGGQKTLETYGKSFYSKIATARWKKQKRLEKTKK